MACNLCDHGQSNIIWEKENWCVLYPYLLYDFDYEKKIQSYVNWIVRTPLKRKKRFSVLYWFTYYL